MITYVALLRGINVGGNNKVEMKRLKALFESLGFKDVSTYINSGNVIFSTSSKSMQVLKTKIETALHKEFSFKISVILRNRDQIIKLCKKVPAKWTNDEKLRTDIIFLNDEFNSKSSLKLLNAVPGIDNVLFIDVNIVWNYERIYINKTAMRKFIGTEIYKNMTARNVNTLRKLKELMK